MLREYEYLLCSRFPNYFKGYSRCFRRYDAQNLLFDMPKIEGAKESTKVETVKLFPRGYKKKDDALRAMYAAREVLFNLEAQRNSSNPDVAAAEKEDRLRSGERKFLKSQTAPVMNVSGVDAKSKRHHVSESTNNLGVQSAKDRQRQTQSSSSEFVERWNLERQ